MEAWHIDLDRESECGESVFVGLKRGNSAQLQEELTPTRQGISIVTDGSRWGRPIQFLTSTNPRSARWQLIVDATMHAQGMTRATLHHVTSAIERWAGGTVAQLAIVMSGLLGPEFAFALVDKELRRLALVRDPIGSRPLYWCREGRWVSFSSSRERLLAATQQSGIDSAAVAIYLGTGGGAWSTTEFLKGFHRVPHGGFALLSRETETSGQWWEPNLNSRSARHHDGPKSAKEIRACVENAIADRIHPELSIAAHVSGGIDSTGVAAIAARQLARAGRTMVAVYAWSPAMSEAHPDMGRRDERHRIEAFTTTEGVPAQFGGATAEDFVRLLARPIELEGTADLADEMPILKMAQADGVKVMLSGWGGDEVFSNHGFGYLSYLLSTSQWEKAAHWMRVRLRSLRRIGPAATMLWWDGIHPMLPDFLYKIFDPYRLRGFENSLLAPSLLHQYRDQITQVSRRFQVTPRPAETMFRHFMAGHLTHRIESWDVWSREYGFNYTYPLTDWRLIEQLLCLPAEHHYPNEKPRGLALAALADVLPAGVEKYDSANEAMRRATRKGAWQILAAMERKGQFTKDCPWLDMKRFREHLANPVDQASTEGVFAFLHLFTAVRVWHMWKRQDE